MLKSRTALFMILSLAASGLLLWHCHDRTWAPADDGYFAHVAERLTQGEVLNRDVQSRHAGYVHFVHAASFSLFGPSLVSMRYPLLLVGMAQAAAVFFFFLPHGAMLAGLASFILTALGYVHYLTPMTHWYCLFFTVLLAVCLKTVPQRHAFRLPLLGFLFGLIVLFRQLTGLFVGIGLVICIFLDYSDSERRPALLAKTVLGILTAGLLLYLVKYGDLLGFFLFGLWPLFLAFCAFQKISLPAGKVGKLFFQLGLGSLAAALPLVIYHTVHGSTALWIEDVAFRAGNMMETTDYRSWSTYALYMAKGLLQILNPKSLTTVLNGFYWILLPWIPFLNGLFLSLAVFKKKPFQSEEAFSLLAVFYALVAHILQTHFFLYYCLGFSLAALLLIVKKHFTSFYRPLFAAACFLTAVSVVFHAGQTHERGMTATIEGERPPLFFSSKLSKARVQMPQEMVERMEGLVAAIHRHSQPDEAIWVLVNDPELYFLSDRRNPFRFDFLPVALQSEKDLLQILEDAKKKAPRLMIFHRNDKYQNDLSVRLMTALEKDYEAQEDAEGFGVYLLKRD
jgi:hypothetical protein